MVWRDRSVSRATLIAVGRSLLVLDEDGTLALATPNDTGLMIQGGGRAHRPRLDRSHVERHDLVPPRPQTNRGARAGEIVGLGLGLGSGLGVAKSLDYLAELFGLRSEPRVPNYSFLNADKGSTIVARRAGR